MSDSVLANLVNSARRICVDDPMQIDTRDDDRQRTVKLKSVPPYRFHLHPPAVDQVISPIIKRFGVWEPFETEVMLRLLPLADTFIDVGANIGWYTALASRAMRKGGAIYAFEPDSRNFRLLEQNASGVPLTTNLANAAVADRSGRLKLFLSEDNVGDHQLFDGGDGRRAITVNVVSLDAHINRPLGSVLMKVDTQGSDAKVFGGASRLMKQWGSSAAYLVEFWPFGIERAGDSVAAMVRALSALPHQPLLIEAERSRLVPVTWDEMLHRSTGDLHPSGEQFVDLLLVAPGSPARAAVADLMS